MTRRGPFASGRSGSTGPSAGQPPDAITFHLQREILATLRAAGGRICLPDLLLDLRCRAAVQWQGAPAETLERELARLASRGLVRGPMGNPPCFELTTAGWDASQRL